MTLDLPVLLLLLSGAAVLQDLLPGWPLKLPWLAAVALYYVLCRPGTMAAVAAVWAGVLQDALGGLPVGGSALLLLAVAGVVLPLRRFLLNESALTAAAAGAALGLLMTLWQYVWLRAGAATAFGPRPVLLAALGQALAAAPVTAAVYLAARSLDRLAGNLPPRKEVHGLGWHTHGS